MIDQLKINLTNFSEKLEKLKLEKLSQEQKTRLRNRFTL